MAGNRSEHIYWPYLHLFDQNDQLLKGLVGPVVFNIPYDGESAFTWDGRVDAIDVGSGRRIPTPPGAYRLGIYTFDNLATVHVDVQIVSNSWDGDSDDISDAVEDENAGIGGPVTTIKYQGNTYYYNRTDANSPPQIPTTITNSNDWYENRGTHDYSLARGTETNGQLENGLRIANQGTGYQYYSGCDPPDSDNWGTLELIRLVEHVGRKWEAVYPSYPTTTSMDMSREGGGFWQGTPGCPGHDQHQKGLEVDARYIRNDNSSGPLNIILNPNDYSPSRTQDLVNLFNSLGTIIVIFSADPQLSGTTFDGSGEHNDHLHIWIADPDGIINN